MLPFTLFLKSPHYKTDYCAILKDNIAKFFSIIKRSEGIFGPKTNKPRLEMVFFKFAPILCFIQLMIIPWSSSAVTSRPGDVGSFSSIHF